MDQILKEDRFNFITPRDKSFIAAFDDAMMELGYDHGGNIGSGYCWGRYMLIYRRSGLKSQNVYARIYIRESTIVLRLFLNGIDKHREYINHAPGYVKEVFIDDHGTCKHCHNEQAGKCRFRKSYTLDDHLIEKCNGITFEFHDPSVQKLPDYIDLFTEFFPQRKR